MSAQTAFTEFDGVLITIRSERSFFTEADGHTTLTILVQATSKLSRDAIIDSGMEAGLQDAMNLLEQVAVALR